MRGVLAIVGTLALLGVTGLTAPGAAAPRQVVNHDGKYQGSFTGIDQPGVTVIANSVELEVAVLNIEGRLKLHVQTADGASILDLSGGESSIAIPLCIILELPLSKGQVSGLQTEADAIQFAGDVQVDIGAADPKRVDCKAVTPTQAESMHFEANVGPDGSMTGKLKIGKDVLEFSAKRTGGSGSGGGSGGSGSPGGGSGSTGSGGTTPEDGDSGTTIGVLIDEMRPLLPKDAVGDVERILEQDGASIGSTRDLQKLVDDMDRLPGIDSADEATVDAVAVALVLANCTVPGKDGPVAAFPNVLALQPVFANLLAKAALMQSDAGRAAIKERAHKLLEMALFLDVVGVTPKPK